MRDTSESPELYWRYWIYEDGQPADKTEDLTGPEFWWNNERPDEYSQMDCVNMRIRHPSTPGLYNWEGGSCTGSLNGQVGQSHGFICSRPAPETTTKLVTTLSSTLSPTTPSTGGTSTSETTAKTV